MTLVYIVLKLRFDISYKKVSLKTYYRSVVDHLGCRTIEKLHVRLTESFAGRVPGVERSTFPKLAEGGPLQRGIKQRGDGDPVYQI